MYICGKEYIILNLIIIKQLLNINIYNKYLDRYNILLYNINL